MHQRVYDLFPDINKRCFQFCAKYSNGTRLTILIQSKEKPITPLYGSLEVKKISDDFFEHKKYLFQCKFCPVKQISNSNKVIPIKDDEEVFEWLISRENIYGVVFNRDTLMKSCDGSIIMKQKDNPSKVHIDYVEITGVLEVIDNNSFKKVIDKGIGRSKGFGLGMIQLRPIE